MLKLIGEPCSAMKCNQPSYHVMCFCILLTKPVCVSDMHLSNVYISAGCNQSPNCMSWKGHHLLYGSANAVVVVQKDEESLEAVQSYVAHKAKVNCVRWIDDEDYFLSCSTDKTVVIWKKQGDTAAQFRPLNILEGHEKSVTVASAIKLAGDDTSFLVASASGDLTLRIWKVADETSCQVISLKNSVALDVKVVVLEDSGLPLIFASLDDCKIHILGPHGGNNFVKLHRLVGTGLLMHRGKANQRLLVTHTN